MSEGWNATLLFAVCLALALVLGAPLIRLLRRLSARQHAYEDAPRSHAVKSGTPTMGGLLFLLALAVAVVWDREWTTLALGLLGLGCGLIGFLDDVVSIRSGRNRGLRARTKFLLTGLVALGFLWMVERAPDYQLLGVVFSLDGTRLTGPHWVWFALAFLAIVATAHAVNLTDGLDGLAAGAALPPLAVLAWLGWRASVPAVTYIDLATAASALGFLVFNRHPAKMFMGDTGSLALGGVLAGSAILSGNTLLLPLLGGVFAAEALSVILQVVSYKTTRKRIFRMSPLHHHFELAGWPETKVTGRFWTASALLSLAGAALAR